MDKYTITTSAQKKAYELGKKAYANGIKEPFFDRALDAVYVGKTIHEYPKISHAWWTGRIEAKNSQGA